MRPAPPSRPRRPLPSRPPRPAPPPRRPTSPARGRRTSGWGRPASGPRRCRSSLPCGMRRRRVPCRSWTSGPRSLPPPSTPPPSPSRGPRRAGGVERVLDGLLLVGLMMLAIASPDFPGHATIGTTSVARVTVGAAVFFGAVLLVAVLVVHRPAPWLALLRRVTYAVLPERLAAPLTRIGEGPVAGLEGLEGPGRFSPGVAWSLLAWLLHPAPFPPGVPALGL